MATPESVPWLGSYPVAPNDVYKMQTYVVTYGYARVNDLVRAARRGTDCICDAPPRDKDTRGKGDGAQVSAASAKHCRKFCQDG
jgi:hypothetical protein